MFSIQPVTSSNSMASDGDNSSKNEGLGSGIAAPDLESQQIEDQIIEGQELGDGANNTTPSQGSYVSLLADIATVDQDASHLSAPISNNLTSSYTNSSYVGQDQIQVLADTDLSSNFQNENIVTYQTVHTQNIDYNLTNLNVNPDGLQHYVIIQPMGQFAGENQTVSSNSFVHFTHTSDSQVNIESNREVENAVANITENAVIDAGETLDSEASAEKGFLVRTNNRGEIQVIQDDQEMVLPYRQRGGRRGKPNVKSKDKGPSLQRKEYSQLKRFSIDDLTVAGKSKKEVIEEYLGKRKELCKADEINDGPCSSEGLNISNEQSKLPVEHAPIPTSDSLLNEYENAPEKENQLNTDEDQDKVKVYGKEGGEGKEIKSEVCNMKVVSNKTKTTTERLAEHEDVTTGDTGAEDSHSVFNKDGSKSKETLISYRTRSQLRKTTKQLKSTLAYDKKGKTNTEKLRRQANKRKNDQPPEFAISSKELKLVEEEAENIDDNVEGRVLDDFCRLYDCDNKLVLRINPINISLVKPKATLVIELQVEDRFKVSSVEKDSSVNGFTKYSLDLTLPEDINEVKRKEGSCDKSSDKLDIANAKYRRKIIKTKKMKNKNSNATGWNNFTASSETSNKKNTLISLNEDIQNELNEMDAIENIEDGEAACGHDLLDIDQVSLKENSGKSDEIDKPNATKTKKVTGKKSKRITSASKPEVLEEQREMEVVATKKEKDVRGDSQEKCYAVVISEEGTRMYMCPICGYMSKFSQNTAKHVREHTATKDWTCELCGMSFKSNNRLQKHKIAHQTVRPFSCPLCDQKFKSNPVLKQHIKRHIGVKAFVCEYCSKEFVTKGDLYKHMRCHTGLTPYHCKDCNIGFKDISTFYRHTASKHSAAGYFICSICNENFTTKANALGHLQKCHPDAVVSTDREKRESLLMMINLPTITKVDKENPEKTVHTSKKANIKNVSTIRDKMDPAVKTVPTVWDRKDASVKNMPTVQEVHIQLPDDTVHKLISAINNVSNR